MRKDPIQKERARRLRRELTPAERILWPELRGRRFAGFKFRRQHPLGPFILDFYCAEACLVVELDGETHLGKERADKEGQIWLEAHGLTVARFWNNQIYDDHEAVLEAIWRLCEGRKNPSPPAPLPEYRGEGRKNPSPPAPLP